MPVVREPNNNLYKELPDLGLLCLHLYEVKG